MQKEPIKVSYTIVSKDLPTWVLTYKNSASTRNFVHLHKSIENIESTLANR